MAGSRICEVFRSGRKEGMYLFVDRTEGLQRVPDSLLDMFGRPQSALVLELNPQRKLARASAAEVLDAIEARGYYLQMPPQDNTRNEEMREEGMERDAD